MITGNLHTERDYIDELETRITFLERGYEHLREIVEKQISKPEKGPFHSDILLTGPVLLNTGDAEGHQSQHKESKP